jgi:hypothetical protein
MTLRKGEDSLIWRRSSRSHYVERSLWKRLWTCRKTDCWMNEVIQKAVTSPSPWERRVSISQDSQKCNLSRYYFFSRIAVSTIYSQLKCYPVTEHKILCKMFSETSSASLRQHESDNCFQVLSSTRLKRRATFESSLRINASSSNMK